MNKNIFASEYVSKNGYRLFFMVNHDIKKITGIERTNQSRYSVQPDWLEELKTFKDVKEKHSQFINRGYELIQ